MSVALFCDHSQPRRFLDTSKQGFAAFTIHLANMGIATLLAAEAPDADLDGCSWSAGMLFFRPFFSPNTAPTHLIVHVSSLQVVTI